MQHLRQQPPAHRHLEANTATQPCGKPLRCAGSYAKPFQHVAHIALSLPSSCKAWQPCARHLLGWFREHNNLFAVPIKLCSAPKRNSDSAVGSHSKAPAVLAASLADDTSTAWNRARMEACARQVNGHEIWREKLQDALNAEASTKAGIQRA